MLRLYIVRHGETVWNTENKMQGWLDSPLTNKGIEMAKQVGKYLKDVEINRVYSSPAGRAYQTAQYIVGNRSIEIKLEEDLKEMSFGDWEGKCGKDILALEGERFQTLWKKPTQYQAITGEDFYQLRERAKNGLQTILMENKSGNILIVSHAALIKTMVYEMKNEELDDQFWDKYFIPNCSITTVKYNGGKFNIEKLGETVGQVNN